MSDTKPEIVYHYTSQGGLIGILKTKKIWATDLFYLNDASEFNHAIDIAKRQLKELAEILPSEDTLFVERIDTYLKKPRPHIYTASFSEEENALSQWKLYGSNYHGFSIGFNLSELKAYQRKGEYELLKCSYDQAEESRKIRDDLEDRLQQFRIQRQNFGNIQESANVAALMFYTPLLVGAASLKKSSFKAEREWRMVRHYFAGVKDIHKEAEFRESRFSIIPYEEVPLPQNGNGIAVREIFMGPALDPELTRRSLELLLPKHDIDPKQVEIKPSGIPIRD